MTLRAHIGTIILATAALLATGCDGGAAGNDAAISGGDAGTRDGGPPGGDAGLPGTDAGPAVADAGPAASDAGPRPGYPTPAYDMMGCLTFASVNEICNHDSNAACGRVTGCGLSDPSQCSIDCTMAATLCLEMTIVDACIAALEGGDCMSVESSCRNWMHF